MAGWDVAPAARRPPDHDPGGVGPVRASSCSVGRGRGEDDDAPLAWVRAHGAAARAEAMRVCVEHRPRRSWWGARCTGCAGRWPCGAFHWALAAAQRSEAGAFDDWLRLRLRVGGIGS